MNNGTNPIEIDAEIERASAAVRSDEKINDLMHLTPSEDKRKNYDSAGDVMMTNAEAKRRV